MKSGLTACLGDISFTEMDYEIVFSKLRLLEPLVSCALYLNFWWNVDWTKIAELYEMEMGVMSQVVSDAFSVLREACIRDSRFSRYQPAQKTTEIM
jgi:hypothetical protein